MDRALVQIKNGRAQVARPLVKINSGRDDVARATSMPGPTQHVHNSSLPVPGAPEGWELVEWARCGHSWRSYQHRWEMGGLSWAGHRSRLKLDVLSWAKQG